MPLLKFGLRLFVKIFTVVVLVIALHRCAHADPCLDRAYAAARGVTNPSRSRAVYNREMEKCANEQGACYVKLVEVCPIHKPRKKLPPKVVPGPLVEYRERVVEKVVDKVVPGPTVIVRVPGPVVHIPGRVVTLYRYRCPGCGPEPKLVVGGWAAIGFGVQDPYVTGNIGLQLRLPPAHLGLRVYSALQYGFGGNLLIYPYQGERVKLHVLDPGVFVNIGNSYLSDQDIKRRLDLTLGAGVEVKLTCHLAITADLRTSIPDPTVLTASDCSNSCRARIDAAAAVGNAFAATQLLVGLLLHN